MNEEKFLEGIKSQIVQRGKTYATLGAGIDDLFLYLSANFGQLIRSRWMYVLASDLHIQVERLISIAAGIELLHVSSLIHDDLPSLDNAKMRRGIKCTHLEFSEGEAVLIGNLLSAAAFSHISVEDNLNIRTAMSLAWERVQIGQLLDINKDYGPGHVETIRNKTAALFIAAATCVQASQVKDSLRSIDLGFIGERAGILFQLKDDIDDGEILSGGLLHLQKECKSEAEQFFARNAILKESSEFFKRNFL